MIETLIEIITKTDLATYGPVGLVLIISLIVAYELIRVQKNINLGRQQYIFRSVYTLNRT